MQNILKSLHKKKIASHENYILGKIKIFLYQNKFIFSLLCPMYFLKHFYIYKVAEISIGSFEFIKFKNLNFTS